jgi:tetratricopeptide (TPR) repeat protein
MARPNPPAASKSRKAAVPPEIWDLDGRRFRRIVTLIIAGVAFLATAVEALRVESSARAASADREARVFLVTSIGKASAGTQRYTLERGLMAEFQALVAQGSVDLRLAEQALSRGEALIHLQDVSRLNLVRENLRGFSTLLNPPYCEPRSGLIDVLRFGVDTLVVPALKWTERQEVKSEQASAWGAKSDRYIVVITVLAVSLFLLGLSLTLGGRLKIVFAGLGCLITAVALVAVLFIVVSPIPRTSEEAIKSYVDGAGQLSYAGMLALAGGDTPQAQAELVRHADQAIASLCQALLIKRDYASARLALGETHLLVARSLLLNPQSGTDPDQARAEIGLAVDCLRRAARLGLKTPRVYKDLAWAHILAGEYGEAVSAAERALALAPELRLSLGLDIALGLVAEGKSEAGSARLEDALSWAQAHPLASDVFAFRAMIHDLDRLMDVRPIVGLDKMRKRLKEAFVSISYRRTIAVTPVPAVLGPLRFSVPGGIDPAGFATGPDVNAFPPGTERVDCSFDYAKLPAKCGIVQKVYWQGKEATWLDRALEWSGRDAGRTALSIRSPIAGTSAGLNPGRYAVELYVDGNLLQRGEFEIASK